MPIISRFHLVELTLAMLFAGGALAASEAPGEKPLTVKGGRFLTLNTVIRVNQIEAARNLNEGTIWSQYGIDNGDGSISYPYSPSCGHGCKPAQDKADFIDFTRYDFPAREPADPTANHPTRNWSLINRINQKHRRPEDAPVLLKNLTAEEQALIKKRCPGL